MAWNGHGEEEEEERGLELTLALPGYFSRSSPPCRPRPGLEGKATAADADATGAKGSSHGSKARRPAVSPVVGWPPVRSFRRNLAAPATTSTKPSSHGARDGNAAGTKVGAGGRRGLFVKINMDGVPIGRKVDLTAHGSYVELSAAVDHLFRGLLAAQRDPAMAAASERESCSTGGRKKQEEEVIGGLLDGGSGEYTLVYEDDEGDQMLVGDVPWNMFVAAARRLRVLRSSDLNPSSLRQVRKKTAAAE